MPRSQGDACRPARAQPGTRTAAARHASPGVGPALRATAPRWHHRGLCRARAARAREPGADLPDHELALARTQHPRGDPLLASTRAWSGPDPAAPVATARADTGLEPTTKDVAETQGSLDRQFVLPRS